MHGRPPTPFPHPSFGFFKYNEARGVPVPENRFSVAIMKNFHTNLQKMSSNQELMAGNGNVLPPPGPSPVISNPLSLFLSPDTDMA